MPLSVSCAAGGRIVAGLFVALGWCWRVDSNHRPTDYESVALPAELRQPASRARRASPHYISGKTGDGPPFSFAAKGAGLKISKIAVCPRLYWDCGRVRMMMSTR